MWSGRSRLRCVRSLAISEDVAFGPAMTAAIGLYQFLGYCLLVICALLALRVLAAVFRTGP